MIQLADGSTVRGAKKGGITDHIAGPHLIPNVGREAMVPAECVRRSRPPKRPVPKPAAKAKQPAVTEVVPSSKRRRGHQADRKRERSRSPRKARSEQRSPRRIEHRSRSKDSESSAPVEPEAPEQEEAVSAVRREVSEEDKRRARILDEEATERERKRQEEAIERERKRQEEERRMLAELEEARKKRQELEAARRKNLGGAFALTEDDIDAEEDEDNQKARAARELARAEERRAARERLTHKDAAPGTGNPAASSGSYPERSSSSAIVAAGAPMRLVNKDSVTAADIDGSLHEHKFAKVWKDWDASKKDDPGEIARQFMRVSAVKRRGYCPPKRTMWSRSRSRSRSRRR